MKNEFPKVLLERAIKRTQEALVAFAELNPKLRFKYEIKFGAHPEFTGPRLVVNIKAHRKDLPSIQAGLKVLFQGAHKNFYYKELNTFEQLHFLFRPIKNWLRVKPSKDKNLTNSNPVNYTPKGSGKGDYEKASEKEAEQEAKIKTQSQAEGVSHTANAE